MRQLRKCPPSPRIYAWIRSGRVKRFLADFVYDIQSNMQN